ncbi:hypothetical protein OROMI_017433 [Orobanche minor]
MAIKKIRRSPMTTISGLPDEIPVYILARVGAASATDLFSAKLSCKAFHTASEDDEVLRRIEIDTIKNKAWYIGYCPCWCGEKTKTINRRAKTFAIRCLLLGNPGSLYRTGMRRYFRFRDPEVVMAYIRMAVEAGHKEATFFLGMVHLDEGRGSIEEGLNLLNQVYKESGRTWDVNESLVKVTSLANSWWKPQPPNVEGFHIQCPKRHTEGIIRRYWGEDEQVYNCEYCLWVYYFIMYCRNFNVEV